MIFKVENLEINLKGVFKAFVLTSIGLGLCRAIHRTRMHTTYIILNEQKKERKVSKKNEKVESN